MKHEEIEFYFRYEYLDTSDLTVLFGKLDKLFKVLVKHSYLDRKIKHTIYPLEISGYFLEIESINTGNSINIKFKEGWKPSIKVSKSKLNINVPVNLGIPAIVLYLLLLGAQKIITLKNDLLDGQLKEMELKIQEQKYKKEQKNDYNMVAEGESIYFSINYYPRPQQKQAQNIITFLLQNPHNQCCL